MQTHSQPQHYKFQTVVESLEHGDMHRVVSSKIHVDEFKSKMGEDQDICVFSFKVMGKEAAEDLSNFIEKGYKWVLDADTSSGEMEDGDYIVFVEAERRRQLPKQIMELVEDLLNLTLNDIQDWKFSYYKDRDYYPLTQENLYNKVPLTPRDYRELFGKDSVKEMKIAAGLPVVSDYQRTPQLDLLQTWAGIK